MSDTFISKMFKDVNMTIIALVARHKGLVEAPGVAALLHKCYRNSCYRNRCYYHLKCEAHPLRIFAAVKLSSNQ